MTMNPNVKSRLHSDYIYLGVCVFTLAVLVGSMVVVDGVEVPSEEPILIENDSSAVCYGYDTVVENGEVTYIPIFSDCTVQENTLGRHC